MGRQPVTAAGIEEAVAALAPVGLDEMDRRSALRQRVDTKYAVPAARLRELIEGVAGGYDALEIDGRRAFKYESVYFDTPGLRCFHDHVDGSRPRFKARSRYYRDTRACFFEVKVKTTSEDMVKRQWPYEVRHHGALTDPALGFLESALLELTDHPQPPDLAPSLSTRYRRMTLSAATGRERATLDLRVRMTTMDGRSVDLNEDYALVETKSDRGGGELDAALAAAGYEAISISKYRLGVGLLLAEDPEGAHQQSLRSRFS